MRVPPLIWGGLTAVAMWFTAHRFPQFGFHLGHWWLWSLCFGLLGVSVALSGVSCFRAARTTVNPLSGENVTVLVRSGIYRFSRNPMYLGMLLLLVGWSAYLSNWLAFAYLPVFVKVLTEVQIKPEERILGKKFGREYEEFLATTSRWLG